MATRLKPDGCSDPAQTGVANLQCEEAIAGQSPGSTTSLPPSPTYGPCRTSWTARQQPRLPVTTTIMVMARDTVMATRPPPWTDWADCRGSLSPDYLGQQPLYRCSPTTLPCYSTMTAFLQPMLYADSPLTAVIPTTFPPKQPGGCHLPLPIAWVRIPPLKSNPPLLPAAHVVSDIAAILAMEMTLDKQYSTAWTSCTIVERLFISPTEEKNPEGGSVTLQPASRL